MSDILQQIIADKKKEVQQKKRLIPQSFLRNRDEFKEACCSLKYSLLEENATGIIAEFKRRSPSKGWINKDADAFDIVIQYELEGASGVSILTDEIYFGGTLDDLINGRIALTVPILRKDFIIDEYQVIESKAWGADVILLIAACLTKDEVKKLSFKAKQLGMEVLLELHDEAELAHICDNIDMIGVNNRNLKTLEVDVQTSLRLIEKLPTDKPAISESGITDVNTIAALKQVGYKGFLMGENFMKHADPAIAFAEFIQQLKQNSSPEGGG